MPIKNGEGVKANSSDIAVTWTTIGILSSIIGIWLAAVNKLVPDPYLDEVFHVGQAQQYIRGNYFVWDPKITTPPGLYLVSTAISYLTSWNGIAGLRLLNVLLLPFLMLLINDPDTKQEENARIQNKKQRSATVKATSWPALSPQSAHQLHTAFNICLFPPLFFFTALYYTDVASAVSVFVCWKHFTRAHQQGQSDITQDVITIALSLISLTFRQTNIFWVSVFPAALLVVSQIDIGLHDDAQVNEERLYDPPVRAAWVDDYIYCTISVLSRTRHALSTTLLGRSAYLPLVRMLAPHAIVLLCFVGFVAWNGSVVLGDKSNHVATLHLAQLLYLWPYITFFSIPLTYPYLLQAISAIFAMLTTMFSLEANLIFKRKKILPRPFVAGGFLAAALLIVRFSTVIHPFTLADNRHYTFYVFRLLLRHPAIKFFVTPIYVATAWSTIQTLGAPAVSTPGMQVKVVGQSDEATVPSNRPLKINHAAAAEGNTVSFVIVWLATTSLQLATAPLVEPRYIIIPWIMWRMRVPEACPPALAKEQSPRGGVSMFGSVKARAERVFWYGHDHRLWLETVWFLAINLFTAYMFLYRGFEWTQEPDRVQRFMW